jgi:hypothetical protein
MAAPREFFAFIRALWEEWEVLLTGGTFGALLVLYGSVSGKAVAHHVGWVFLFATFLWSVFLSWRKQWREAEKNFVALGVAQLMELREGKTSPLANTILRPYIGKRIRVTGKLSDVSDRFFLTRLIHLRSEGILLAAQVPFWSASKFLPIPKGTVISLTGTISEIGTLAIQLVDVDLVPNPPIVAPLGAEESVA